MIASGQLGGHLGIHSLDFAKGDITDMSDGISCAGLNVYLPVDGNIFLYVMVNELKAFLLPRLIPFGYLGSDIFCLDSMIGIIYPLEAACLHAIAVVDPTASQTIEIVIHQSLCLLQNSCICLYRFLMDQ